MKVHYLQVPEDLRKTKAGSLADLLSERTGKRVTRGDALYLVLDLWAWVLDQVNDGAEDMAAEMDRRTILPTDRACSQVSLATGWPKAKSGVLLECLADTDVGVLEAVDGGWRVHGLGAPYLKLASDLRDAREKSQTYAKAKAAGWEPGDKKGEWYHPSTKVSVGHWRELREVLALGGGNNGP